jgi:hypothetical protein
LRKREVWLPTWRGWLLLAAIFTATTLTLLFALYPFLSINDPLSTGAIVVEGWGNRSTLRQAGERFLSLPYTGFYVTGGPIDSDSPLDEYGTFANLGLSELKKMGGPPAIAVPAPRVKRDRTYVAALALREWMDQHGGIPSEITVVSQGAHTRRTRLLFEKAFAGHAEIGILSARVEGEYDPYRWWTYSAGFRDVTAEAIAYLYARLLFWK